MTTKSITTRRGSTALVAAVLCLPAFAQSAPQTSFNDQRNTALNPQPLPPNRPMPALQQNANAQLPAVQRLQDVAANLFRTGRLKSVAEPVMQLPLGPAKLKHTQILEQLSRQRATVEIRRTAILSAAKLTLPAAVSSVGPSQRPSGFSEVSGFAGTAVPPGRVRPPPAPTPQPGPTVHSAAVGKSLSAVPPLQPASLAGRAEVLPAASIGTAPATSPTPPNAAFARGTSICMQPTINAVNGAGSGSYFTQDPSANQYVIEGCGFGSQQGEAHLYGPFAQPVVGLTIQYWSDTAIIATMDANISGEPDHYGNVNLVVAPVGAAQLRASGFTFYAMRELTLLRVMPQSQVTIQQDTDTALHPVPHFYESPIVGWMPSGFTFDVTRIESGRFGSAQDSFNFSNLAPGFYVEKINFSHADMQQASCPNYYVDGNWNSSWDANAHVLQVTTQEQHCHGLSDYFIGVDWSTSIYFVVAVVVGPKGINPWPASL
ncbi:MAG TPA: hypothetical protein VGD54_20350 [Steroidobacteraceae bacterium]